MSLTENQKQRYLRNTILPEIGEEGQGKLLRARVLVVGAGGLGSPVLFYLAAAGVGNIGVIDYDVVELSNLQRQVIHNEKNLGEKKAYDQQSHHHRCRSKARCLTTWTVMTSTTVAGIWASATTSSKRCTCQAT